MIETIITAIEGVSYVVISDHHGGRGEYDGDDRAASGCPNTRH